jgi:hypothetical protein
MAGFTVGEQSSDSGEHDAYPGPAVALGGIFDKVRQPLGRVDQLSNQVFDPPKRSVRVALPTVPTHAAANLAAQFSTPRAWSRDMGLVRAPRAQTTPSGGISNVAEPATSTAERLGLLNLEAPTTAVTPSRRWIADSLPTVWAYSRASDAALGEGFQSQESPAGQTD